MRRRLFLCLAILPLLAACLEKPSPPPPAAAAAAGPAAPAKAASGGPPHDPAGRGPGCPPAAVAAAVEAAAAAAAPPPPAPLKSPEERACEKTGGRFAPSGTSGALSCVRQTRDGGKRCSRARDCEGLCLARSMTCSPITPVFGCQDILQQDGLRVTECVD